MRFGGQTKKRRKREKKICKIEKDGPEEGTAVVPAQKITLD